MFSCNDDHLRAAPSGYPHQVIHISNTQGTPEQVSSPNGRGADPKPQPNTPLPCAGVRGAGGRGGLRAQLFEPRAQAGGAGHGAGATSR